MKFELTPLQVEKYKYWIDKQRATCTGTGFIDIGPKFSFTQTSIGFIVEVEYGGNKLDLSEDF